jgi:hypothetical protein
MGRAPRQPSVQVQLRFDTESNFSFSTRKRMKRRREKKKEKHQQPSSFRGAIDGEWSLKNVYVGQEGRKLKKNWEKFWKIAGRRLKIAETFVKVRYSALNFG